MLKIGSFTLNLPLESLNSLIVLNITKVIIAVGLLKLQIFFPELFDLGKVLCLCRLHACYFVHTLAILGVQDLILSSE